MRPKFAKTKPRQLTINVTSVDRNTIRYYLLHDHCGQLYEFVMPFDNPIDLSIIQPTGFYQVQSRVNHRGSYVWTEVRVLKRPIPKVSSNKSKDLIDRLFEF